MSESNSRTQPRNLKVAYGGYVWKFPRKISTSPKAVETRFEGTQSRADAVKFASRIHYANPLPPPPPPPPGHLRPLPPFNRERREEEEEERKVSRFQQLRFTGCRNIITMSSSPAVVSMSTVSIPIRFCFQGDDILASTREPPRNRFEIIDANCGRYGIKRTVGND